MRKDSPCNKCPAAIAGECRDMCPFMKKWLSKKEEEETLRGDEIPFELLGDLKVTIQTIH